MSSHDLDWESKPPQCTCGKARFAGSKTFTLERYAAHLVERLAFSEQTTTNVMDALAASGAETQAAEERLARAYSLGAWGELVEERNKARAALAALDEQVRALAASWECPAGVDAPVGRTGEHDAACDSCARATALMSLPGLLR